MQEEETTEKYKTVARATCHVKDSRSSVRLAEAEIRLVAKLRVIVQALQGFSPRPGFFYLYIDSSILLIRATNSQFNNSLFSDLMPWHFEEIKLS